MSWHPSDTNEIGKIESICWSDLRAHAILLKHAQCYQSSKISIDMTYFSNVEKGTLQAISFLQTIEK